MEQQDRNLAKTRDFACSCGKKYFSYAALFTHIKQKHEGKAPGPIVRPRSERKRGRPRKTPLLGEDNKNSYSEFGNNSNGLPMAGENNNSINSSEMTKKAAQMLLGSGSFQAFKAYRGDDNCSALQNQNIALKKVISQPENGPKAEVKLNKKSLSSTSKLELLSQEANSKKREQSSFIESHNKKLLQVFQEYCDLSQKQSQLGKILAKQCSLFHKQGIISSISDYLGFTHNFLTQLQHLVIHYIMNMFIQFLFLQAPSQNTSRPIQLEIHQICNHIDQFINFFQLNNLAIFCPCSENDQLSFLKDPSNNNFLFKMFKCFESWVNYSLGDKYFIAPQKSSELKIEGQESHEYKENISSKKMIRIQTKKSTNNKNKKPRVISTIEDILAENNSENSFQLQQGMSEEEEDDLPIEEIRQKCIQ